MEHPRGTIINGDRLREIIQIKDRPGNRNAQLSNKHREELKTLRNKLINLYKTEHEEALFKTSKHLLETHEKLVTQ